MDSRRFRTALGQFATGITVVTARTADGRPVGLTVNAFTSVSLTPPLILVCLGDQTTEIDAYTAGGRFNVHVLSADQEQVSAVFATRGADKFGAVAWREDADGIPRLDQCLAYLRCGVEAVHDGGDHRIVVGRVDDLWHDETARPLVYFRGAYARLS